MRTIIASGASLLSILTLRTAHRQEHGEAMTTSVPSTSSVSIDPATEVGMLALTVADLERSLSFYTEAIGLTLLDRGASSAALGVQGRPLLKLQEQPGATPWPRGGRSYTGLYHFAILMPTRADLGRWLYHWLQLGLPLPGQGDHLVSEALYLEDPDGHGIEVYRDRPRDEWTWSDGLVRMATDPVDLRGLLTEAERAGEGCPQGRVSDTSIFKSAILRRQKRSIMGSLDSISSRECRAPCSYPLVATITTSA
jgi:catechol 2,3-dioxygenase-like lactoylglutathione lyase family enzyme